MGDIERQCKSWEKGDDCSWNQRTARMVLVPILLVMLFGSLVVLRLVKQRNKTWLARPVLCLILVSISQLCDIVEHVLVLTELRDNGHDWYSNSSIDSLGDIPLMISLFLFAGIWCDCVRVAGGGAEQMSSSSQADLIMIRRLYLGVVIVTTPMAILFSLGSVTHNYDTFMMLYMLSGVLSGMLLLTPAAFLMHRTIKTMPDGSRDKPLFKQLMHMVNVKVIEQVLWNALISVSIFTVILYLHGGSRSAALIGTTSVCISICWILIQGQVVLFFATVRGAGTANPVFDESMLETLMAEHHTEQPGSQRDDLELTDVPPGTDAAAR
eukprot:CAMPEP_0184551316 /NCGR_PEP_ID=MMETSP0199_2-20130426/24568_1 /TAXON_ID=1112570 /ORGANISM="Thraustochytrium sp., Strain LLF1b" /LENGTH=324 /DNA_ID=CAMNT_0026946445 /DNA_START=270 /DNA_END=1241 /DNA_ORIENTATION=-